MKLRQLLWLMWWHARFFGHALLWRRFDDPRVQTLVDEHFRQATKETT